MNLQWHERLSFKTSGPKKTARNALPPITFRGKRKHKRAGNRSRSVRSHHSPNRQQTGDWSPLGLPILPLIVRAGSMQERTESDDQLLGRIHHVSPKATKPLAVRPS